MVPAYLIQMLREYQYWANSICAPLQWQNNGGQLHNASITLLRSDGGVLGITNKHVSHAIANCSEEIGNRCQIGGAYLDPGRLAAEHPLVDLATYRLSDFVVDQIGLMRDGSLGEGSKHRPGSVMTWPPIPPIEGSAVMYGGYPGLFREERTDGNTDFGFFWFATKVQSVSITNIGMVADPNNSRSLGTRRVPANADLGGWSGGSVFRIVDTGLIERLELCGIIYEYSTTTGIVLAHPLTDLNPDGTFG